MSASKKTAAQKKGTARKLPEKKTAAKKTAARKTAAKTPAAPPLACAPSVDPILSAEPAAQTDAAIPIVGIGASAGGLAAFEAFFSAFPGGRGHGMAFVVVQHLAPDHKSILTELIARYTRMPVLEVTDGMVVEPNCIYIIRPNHDMAFLNGALQLLEPSAPRGHRCPIDFFFRSLAQDQKARSIGIVLSGTGSDGTEGVRAIKGEGGMVMAQDSQSTQYDGMPRSAIATGMVDFVLPPREMPEQLIAYVRRAFATQDNIAHGAGPKADESLKKIYVLLRAQTGHDFSHYKNNTINRRIERRMAVNQIEQVADYVMYLRNNPAEVVALFRDLLIGVTSFFRDPESFKVLEEEVIVRLLSNKPAGATIRVWIPGCSTGEEAYSIAILLYERLETLRTNLKMTLFATDIDSAAIDKARSGIYSAGIAADISPERLARFFIEESPGGFFRVKKIIRDSLVFSEQSLIKDPPFSKLDLISCRNLLIYLNQELHHKLIPLFHYALNPDGFLFLGTSESIGEYAALFGTVNRTAKLYQCKHDGPPISLPVNRFIPQAGRVAVLQRDTVAAGDAGGQLRMLTERTLLHRFAPAGAMVNAAGDILYLHGRTGEYLEPAPGEAAMNILKMARPGLRAALTIALHKAAAKMQPVTHPGLRVKTNGDFSNINLTIQPVTSVDAERALFLVILENASQVAVQPEQIADGTSKRSGAAERRNEITAQAEALKRELREKEEYLQTTTEELETSNEELKSANEEMQSINEEMQSTNEELETSKEELQSVNEELATVNVELQGRVADLSRSNNDMNNLLAGIGVGTIFVNHQLKIQRFTPAVTQVINLIPTDIGRPIDQITANLVNYSNLIEDLRAVVDSLVPLEIEVATKLGKWFLMRIRPYRTLDNVIDGAVITFFEISVMKAAQGLLQEAETLRNLAIVVTDSRDAILVQNMDGRILSWNPAATRMYGWSQDEALVMNIRDMIPPEGRAEALAMVHKLSLAEVLQPYQMNRITSDGGTLRVTLTATALINEAGAVYAIATTERAVA